MSKYSIQGLSDEELDYYSRQIVLKEIGIIGQRKLKEARVCIVGLGGLGSPIAIQLASMGIGYLRLVDRDIVEISNLQRQHLYGVDVVGYPKVEAAADRLKQLNPFIEIEPLPTSLSHINAERIVKGMDVIVDGLDRMTPRYALNKACVKHGVPYVFGAVITNVGNATTIIPGETACLECFRGNVNDDVLPTCAVVGVHPSIISIIASIQTSETIRILLGKRPNLANTLIFCDLRDLSFEKIKLARIHNCPICGTSPLVESHPIKQDLVQEICGRTGRRVFVLTPKKDLDLDLKELNNHLKKLGYILKVEANLGTTFTKEPKIHGSILKSGVTILEGLKSIEEATQLQGMLLNLF